MNTVRLDYFAVTVKNLFVVNIIEDILQIPIDKFVHENWGVNKYQFHYAYADIKIYYNQDKESNMGVFIELKGKGCRQYEEFLNGNENNWIALIQRLHQHQINFTRLDIAHDIFDKSLSVPLIYKYCKAGLCISRAKHFEYHEKSMLETGECIGETVSIGKRGNQQWCIYNKLMEQTGKGVNIEGADSWIRSELRLWQGKANTIAKQLNDKRPLAEIYFEALNGHYRFVRPNDKDKNKWRRQNVKWWDEFLETEEKTTLNVTRTKPTLKKAENWIEKQISKTLAKLYIAKTEVFGEETAQKFLFEVIEKGIRELTSTDETDIRQYILEQQNSQTWGIQKDDLP